MTPESNKMPSDETGNRRIFIPAVTIGMALFVLAGAVLVFRQTRPTQPTDDPSTNKPPNQAGVRPTAPLVREAKTVPQRAVFPQVQPSQGPPGSGQTTLPPPPVTAPVSQTQDSTGLTTQSLAALIQLDIKNGSITKEQAEGFRQRMKQLVQQGSAAIPAIREILARNEDINFASLPGGETMGSASLRTALFDALQQIGGPEAVELSAGILKTTAVPMEVAVLTRSLEQLAPAQYRELELASARNLLAMASGDQWKGGDAGALFEVLQKFGDASVVPDLIKSFSKWKYYSTVCLAGLPDDAGIPALIQLAQDPQVSSMGKGDGALRILAQASLQNADARSALIEQARADRIPDAAWPAVVSALSGTYLQYGNRIFGNTAPAVTWTDTEVSQRLAIVDQIITSTKNTAANQLLQNARSSLASRLKH